MLHYLRALCFPHDHWENNRVYVCNWGMNRTYIRVFRSQTLNGPFSAVSTPIADIKYQFKSAWWHLKIPRSSYELILKRFQDLIFLKHFRHILPKKSTNFYVFSAISWLLVLYYEIISLFYSLPGLGWSIMAPALSDQPRPGSRLDGIKSLFYSIHNMWWPHLGARVIFFVVVKLVWAP